MILFVFIGLLPLGNVAFESHSFSLGFISLLLPISHCFSLQSPPPPYLYPPYQSPPLSISVPLKESQLSKLTDDTKHALESLLRCMIYLTHRRHVISSQGKPSVVSPYAVQNSAGPKVSSNEQNPNYRTVHFHFSFRKI